MKEIEKVYQEKAERAIENIEQSTTKVYKIKPEEVYFIATLLKRVEELELDLIIPLVRMSDGAIQCWFKNIHEESEYPTNGAYLGRINLQGKKTYMQVMDIDAAEDIYDADVIFHNELSMEEYVELLDEWIRYISLIEEDREMWED